MSAKDEKNLAQVIDKIASVDEPARSLVLRVHEVIFAAAPELKPRIWYGMPAYARSASTPALVSLRNDERVSLSLTEKVPLRPRRWARRGTDARGLAPRLHRRSHRAAHRRDRARGGRLSGSEG